MHIGLIGGIGVAATELYYRGIVRRCQQLRVPLELTISHADMDTLLTHLGQDARQAQAGLFADHLSRLDQAGATVCAITSVAGHFCYDELVNETDVPLMSIFTPLEKALQQRGLQRVGLLGSKAAMQSKLYGKLPEIELVAPADTQMEQVSEAYFEMARTQQATTVQRELFHQAGQLLCQQQGAEAVVLVGTDLFLAFNDLAPDYDVLDAADIHINALADLVINS